VNRIERVPDSDGQFSLFTKKYSPLSGQDAVKLRISADIKGKVIKQAAIQSY